MSQVRFYGMELDFEFIRRNYKNENFGKFVLQPYMADAEKWRDEFTLLIYALNDKGFVLEKMDLKIDKKKFLKAKVRVELGNIPFTKKQVEPYIIEDGDPPGKIRSLYFLPNTYGEYVAYKVSIIDKSFSTKVLSDEELKPSPPADPFDQ